MENKETINENQNGNPALPEQNKLTTYLVIGVVAILVLFFAFKFIKGKKGDDMANMTPEQRMTALTEAAKEDPNYNNYFELGLASYQAQKYEDALKYSLMAHSIDPTKALVLSNVGAAYNSLGKFDLGKTYLDSALMLDPSLQIAKNNLKWSIDELAKADSISKTTGPQAK